MLAFFHQRQELLVFSFVDVIAMVVVGKRASLDFGDVLADPFDGDLGQVGESLGKFWLEVDEDSQEIVAKQNLAVRSHPRPDPDRRNLKLPRNDGGDFRRHGFELEHETSSVLNGECVFEDFHRGICSATLYIESTENSDGVGRKPDMRCRWNAGIDEGLEDVRLRFAALRLYRRSTLILHE